MQSMGRIGTSAGTTKKTHYESIYEALSDFERIYLEKTGNEFGTESFVKKPGLYNQININNMILVQNLQTNVPTKLNKPLYELMVVLFGVKKVFTSTLLSKLFDSNSMPLGKLTKAQIQSSLEILHEISSMQNSWSVNQLIAASNKLYSYCPRNFGFQRPPIINTPKIIQETHDMLQHLIQAELQYEFLISESNKEENLLDLCYDHLQKSVEITVLNKTSTMFSEICKYIENTRLHPKPPEPGFLNRNFFTLRTMEVAEVFEVQRFEEILRYAPYENNFNRLLLSHGTSVENLVSILTNGLKVSPPGVKHHGDSSGKGIYFADSISGTMYASKQGIVLVFLCEVAVDISDIPRNRGRSELSPFCESFLAPGKYYPHEMHIRPDGLKIPNGTLVCRNENTSTLFNEYVVPDEARVKIRYLVKLRNS